MSDAGLIITKYSRPEINRYLISRRRLHEKLDNSLMCKLTMVTAPAGCGKTTAVLDWLGKCGVPAAWLSVDSYDNNPMVFWRYVCNALDSIYDGISKSTEYVFSSQELLKSNIHVSILIDRLSEVKSDFLLVLDDLHLITDASILEGLSYLIGYLPAKMHLIIISRTEPELGLARHKIKWQAKRLQESDLRFETEEIFLFYKARGYTLEDDAVKKVETYTEGWAAAMVAVAMSMKDIGGRNDAIAALVRSSRDIAQYLKEEVFSSWHPEKQVFAMKTSILDTLSEALCDAVTEKDNGRRMLKEIGEGSGFLITLDERKQEYRYHPLFKDFLYKLLSETAPPEIAELHIKAARWYGERGFTPEAIEYLLRGGSYKEAFELIEHKIDYLIEKNDFGRLLAWIERLPAGYRDDSFKIAVIYATYYAQMDQYDLSRQWVDRMKALKDNYKYASGPGWSNYSQTVCTMVEANLLVREGKIEFVPMLLSAAETDGGKYYKMPEYYDFNVSDIYFCRCPINRVTGLFKEASDKYNRTIESYREMISKNPGYAPLCAGEYLYESNRPEEALSYLIKAMDEATDANCPGALVPAVVDIARIKRTLGDMPGAFKILDECERKLQGFGKAHWIYLLQAFRCRLYADMKDRDKVDEWFATRKLNIYMEINKIREFELMVYARTLMFKGCLHDAKILLQRLLSFTGDGARLHSQVEVLNLLALLSYENNEISCAVDYLERSLDIGIKEGYVRSFLDESAPMANLLRYYITRRKKQIDRHTAAAPKSYARDLLKEMRENLPAVSEAHNEATAEGMKDSLTEQEKKVLKLIVEANTNREIGEKLGIVLRTVKNHIANIYFKLGVKSRAQCIKLVREAKLL